MAFAKRKIIIAAILLALVFVSACDLIGIDKRGKCSEGRACVYYSGTRGIITYLENAPHTLYYNSRDLGTLDGNVVEFNLKLKNDGASDSHGAAFISGFAPELFDLSIIKDGVETPIIVNKNNPGCYFDLLGLGLNDNFLSSLAFVAGCTGYGVSGSRTAPDRWNIQLDFKKLGVLFGKQWPDIRVNLEEHGENNFAFGLGLDGAWINMLNHGAVLMAMVTNIDYTKWGGAVFYMVGDNEDTPGGDIDYATFKARMARDWPSGQDYFDIPYQIKTCYAYTTLVSPMICVDPNPFSEERKVCTAESYTWGGSQGGPVAVTRLLETNTGKEVVLDITVKNVGPGTVWDVGYLESCSPYFPGRVTGNMKDVVYIGQAWIGDTPVDCSRNYRVRLDPQTKSASFTCKYDIRDAGDIGSAYTIPLKMELWYGYEENINRQLRVRKLG